MTDKSDLGDRMKGYENVNRTYLKKREPMIIRVDGKAFHTYTRGFDKPWDKDIEKDMTAAASYLVQNIQGARLAYVQSDEISILCTDYETHHTDAWFGKNVQKVASVAAAMATMAYNSSASGHTSKHALFDARCFGLQKEEVLNYFIWRQQDATRNSISGLAQKHFSHKKLEGKNTSQQQEMLHSEHGVNWNDVIPMRKRGWCILRRKDALDFDIEHMSSTTEPNVVSDLRVPIFTKDKEYINRHVIGIEDNRPSGISAERKDDSSEAPL